MKWIILIGFSILAFLNDCEGKKYSKLGVKECAKKFEKCLDIKMYSYDINVDGNGDIGSICKRIVYKRFGCSIILSEWFGEAIDIKSMKDNKKVKGHGLRIRVRRGLVGIALKDPNVLTTEPPADHGFQLKGDKFDELIKIPQGNMAFIPSEGQLDGLGQGGEGGHGAVSKLAELLKENVVDKLLSALKLKAAEGGTGDGGQVSDSLLG